MRPALLALAFLLASCSHTSVRVDSGGAATMSTGVSVSYSGSGSAAMWALIGIALIAAEYGGSQAARERGLEPDAKPVPPMDAGRQVNAVDCSQPIQDWSANLKCR
jgi:hypothetical protein